MVSQDALVLIIGTAIFWGLGLLVLPFTLLCKQNGGTARIMAITTTFCAWAMWIMVFISQMNPLVKPQRLKEEGGGCVIA